LPIFPDNYETQDVLAPGGRGEEFIQTLPGDRSGEPRINRTNNQMNVSEHDVPNIKYNVDDRLPALFKYGFSYGYNHIVAPKGRIAAVDPYMDLIDFDSKKQYNTITMANGGVPVRIRAVTDVYKDPKTSTSSVFSADCKGGAALVKHSNKEWIPMGGLDKAYAQDCYRPFVDNTATVTAGSSATFIPAVNMLKKTYSGLTTDYEIDLNKDGLATGRIKDSTTAKVTMNVRPGNIPIGIFERNEHTRGTDAFNGMMAGPIRTDAMIEMPWFAYKDKAESNYWGSAYGTLVPGDLLKSDENGRFVKSPLSSQEALQSMSVAELESERQQVIGSIYAVNTNLVPAGAAKWAVWALEDRLNYSGFNPSEYRQTNRNGEDAIDHSPHASTGEYPGYPYEKAYSDSDLNMLASSKADTFNPRMNQEYQYSELGIPGLTDGYNAVVRSMPEETAATINYRGTADEYQKIFCRLLNVNVEPSSVQMKIGDGAFAPVSEGAVYSVNADAKEFIIDYFDAVQGIVVIKINDKEKADTLLKTKSVDVTFKYSKRGLAGVPTWMDWDGCIGSVKILLNK
jgi:hypothetical protein